MKKWSGALFATVLAVLLTACAENSEMVSVQETIGTSAKFTQEEIADAMDCAEEKFEADFEDCTLTDLWYDEEKSEAFLVSYFEGGHGAYNGVAAENAIVLLSDFDVGASGGDGSLEPDTTYSNWMWVLVRDSASDDWRVDDWGY